MNPYALLPLIGFVANLALAAAVYARSPRDRPNRVLALCCLGIAFWSVLKFARLLIDDAGAAFLLFQLSSVGWAMLPSLYLHFAFALTRRPEVPHGSWVMRAGHGAGVLLAISAFVPGAMATGMVHGPWGYSHTPGPVYNVFAVYSAFLFLFTVVVLYRARARAESNAERSRLGFVLVATLVSTFIGSMTNIWLPIADIYVVPLGEVISTFNVALIAYAMIRHGLLDVSLEQAAGAIIGTMGDALMVVNTEGRVVLTNAAACRLLGVEESEVLDRRLDELVRAESVRRSSPNLISEVTDEVEAQLLPPKGDPIPVILSSNPVHARTGEITGTVVCASDIRDLRRAMARLEIVNERLEHQSITDELTGVSNRRYANQRLADELSHARRYNRPFSVGVIDLDDFKRINDNHGHPVGDRVLQSVAKEISSVLRGGDVVSRWGGDEFFVLLSEADAEQAQAIGERMVRQIAEAAVPGVISDFGVSLGLATFDPEDPDDGSSALLSRADEALYEAKRSGKGRVQQYATLSDAASPT